MAAPMTPAATASTPSCTAARLGLAAAATAGAAGRLAAASSGCCCSCCTAPAGTTSAKKAEHCWAGRSMRHQSSATSGADTATATVPLLAIRRASRRRPLAGWTRPTPLAARLAATAGVAMPAPAQGPHCRLAAAAPCCCIACAAASRAALAAA